MANAIITFKIMPDSPEADFEGIAKQAQDIVTRNGAKGDTKYQINPIAFGLKEVLVLGMFEVKEDLNSEAIAEELAKIENVQSAEVLKMDLAMG